MQIERSDIDGFSNKIYIYSNYDIVIEYYPAEEYRKTKVKLDRNVDLEKVYNYINNCAGKLDTNYKVVLKNGLNKEDKVVFISSKDEEIKDFVSNSNKERKLPASFLYFFKPLLSFPTSTLCDFLLIITSALSFNCNDYNFT